MPSKNSTILSTNCENQHYFETLSVLTLKFVLLLTTALSLGVESGICIQSTTSSSKSTLIMTASHVDISVQGAACQLHKKSMHASVDLLPDGHILQHSWYCNLSKCCRSVHFFQCNEYENVVLPIIIIWHSFSWISGALFEVLSTKRWKKRGTLKALNPNFTSTKLSALVCCCCAICHSLYCQLQRPGNFFSPIRDAVLWGLGYLIWVAMQSA